MKNLLFLILLTGCANKLIFDPKSSTNPANFFADQMECERISEQVSYPEEMAKAAALQGGASALLGALLASKAGISPQVGATNGLISGATIGSGSGAYTTQQRRQSIVRNCLSGRGYKILE
jgi:hypothetical protein